LITDIRLYEGEYIGGEIADIANTAGATRSARARESQFLRNNLPGDWDFRPGHYPRSGRPYQDLSFVSGLPSEAKRFAMPLCGRTAGKSPRRSATMMARSATVAGLSEYLWELEQPAHAVANGYFIAASNRVGIEQPWGIGEFYGKSYFCNPRGKIVAQASRDKDELLVADLDLDEIQQVRAIWQFFRDRRPETYGELVRIEASSAAQAAD
jgi:beta-ureidopropionase